MQWGGGGGSRPPSSGPYGSGQFSDRNERGFTSDRTHLSSDSQTHFKNIPGRSRVERLVAADKDLQSQQRLLERPTRYR